MFMNFMFDIKYRSDIKCDLYFCTLSYIFDNLKIC